MGKKGADNTKKVAGNARKADNASKKQAAVDAQKAVEEDQEWGKGSKSNAKKESAEAKKAEAARKKAERDALLAAEEASQRATPKGAGAKSAGKKSRGTLDLGQLDSEPSTTGASLSATGIDNALDALSLTTNPATAKVERHPERRYKAAYAAYEERRMPELEEEMPGLRRNQRVNAIRKEFEKSEENPFNQVSVGYDASRDEIAEVKQAERAKIEGRLVSKK